MNTLRLLIAMVLFSTLLVGQSELPLLRSLNANKRSTHVVQFDDVTNGIDIFPTPMLDRLNFLPGGEIRLMDESEFKKPVSPKGQWKVNNGNIEVDAGVYSFDPTTRSFFKPAFTGALFGVHLLPPKGAAAWGRLRQKKLVVPELRRQVLHYSMKTGGGHDTVLGLIKAGDASSIPFLIAFLDRWHQCSSKAGIVCDIQHCVEALRTITGQDFGLCAKDWADGLHLSLDDCRRTIRPISPL